MNMNMKRKTSNSTGLILIILGGLALLNATIFPLLGWDFSLWRFWALGVAAIGLAFVAVPFIFPEQPGLKALFIPGVPILVVSSLLLMGSLFRAWGVWEYLWPTVILGLAVGFLATSVFQRNIWLMIPAIIIGINGLIFQFCAITGWWDAWAILWTLEPLAVGLALLVASGGKRLKLMWSGLILCGISVATFSLMSLVLTSWGGVVGAALLIIVGAGLLARERMPILLKEKSPDEKLVDGFKI